MSTGHLSFVSRSYEVQGGSFRTQICPDGRPGTVGRGPPSQSEHRRQSISSPRSLRFAAWSAGSTACGGPGRSASSLLRLRRRLQPSVRCGAPLAPAPSTILLDAWSFMISTLRSHCALRSASPRPLRMHASASRVSSSSGALAARAPAGRYASAARAFISPTAFEQARGGALGAGGGRVGFAGGGLF